MSRIGVVLPSVNTVVEAWLPRAIPAEVSLHVARMLIGPTVTRETLRAMDAHGVQAAQVLATCRPDLIIYGCTASSLVGGREYDLKLMEELEHATRTPSLTTTECVLRATRRLGVEALAVASPYAEDVGRAEVRFLNETGHDVVGEAHLGITDGFDLARPDESAIVDLVRDAWARCERKAQAVYVGCMNLRSHLVVDALERELGVPVVTATQATLWASMVATGRHSPRRGLGRLMELPGDGE